MRRSTRAPALLALLGMLVSLVTVIIPGTAVAAESLPALHWAPVNASAYDTSQTSPQGEYTRNCTGSSYDLLTYDSAGRVVRQLGSAAGSCIAMPVVDKNGRLYGQLQGGSVFRAYDGNVLKWEYPLGSCTSRPVIGSNGIVYVITSQNRLVGLTPDVEPGGVQPRKILDVAVTSTAGCSTGLQAFQGGVAIVRYTSTDRRFIYYRDDGTKISEKAGVGTDTRVPVNAAGRLFYPTFANSRQDLLVSAYDPFVNQVRWTTRVNTTSRPDLRTFRTYPLPSGGVMVAIKADDPQTGGLSVTLVTVASDGHVAWSSFLSGRDAQNNVYSPDNYYAVDTSGKIVVVRYRSEKLSSAPWYVPVTKLVVLDSTNGNTVYDREMRGNRNGAEGEIYGYRPNHVNYDLPIGPYTAYVHAIRCSDNCPGNYQVRMYPVKIPDLGLDYPRGQVLGEPDNPPAPMYDYVAMGDSFSAGEGVEPFEAGTGGEDGCHRSEKAYPRLLEADFRLRLYLGDRFAACSGATTAAITSGYNGEGAQIGKVTSDVDLVTMTIGGNDVSFEDFARACVLGVVTCDGQAYQDALAGIVNNVIPHMEDMLGSLRNRLSTVGSNATVLVVGYPHMIPENPWISPSNDDCWWLNEQEVSAIREVTESLNTAISNEVSAIGGNFRFVSATEADSPFIGHELCRDPLVSEPPYFHNANPIAPEVYTFHPNVLGQQAYAELIAKELPGGR